MKTISVIIAEPDRFIRNQLTEAASDTEAVELKACLDTSDINHTREQILSIEPDVLVLGINHVESEEMELFNELRITHSQIPILVLSNHDKEGAKAAIAALKKGAVEYFPKTKAHSKVIRNLDYFKKRVIPVIKVTPRLNKAILLSPDYIEKKINSIQPISPSLFETSLSRMELLVIAGCLGGIPSLYILLSGLPNNLPVPVIVLQHIEEIYSEVLAEDLNRYTELEVKEAKDGDKLTPGTVFIAPGDFHLQTKKTGDGSYLLLNQQPQVEGFRPSIDLLLESVASHFGPRNLTVILSGGGNDGIEGAKVIDIIGGQVIVQNKYSSLLSDISWKVGVHGIHEGSYPVDRLAHEISHRLG